MSIRAADGDAGMPQAVVVLVRRGGRYLFIERGPGESFSGYWCPVGGEIEPGESHAQAIAREVREEVGVEVRPLRSLGQGTSRSGTFRLHYYLAELVAGEPHVASEEVAALRWVTLAEARRLPKCFAEDLALVERLEAGA